MENIDRNPSEEGVETDDGMKPVIIIPPFVLGANILSFLPKEQKSYAHCFANKGISPPISES
jgi:hypothetical protein